LSSAVAAGSATYTGHTGFFHHLFGFDIRVRVDGVFVGIMHGAGMRTAADKTGRHEQDQTVPKVDLFFHRRLFGEDEFAEARCSKNVANAFMINNEASGLTKEGTTVHPAR